MFGIGTTEVLIILAVALVVIGPSKLPELARTLGKGMAEFRRMSSDLKHTIDMEADRSDSEQKRSDAQKELFGDKNEQSKRAEQQEASDQEKTAASDSPSEVDEAVASTEKTVQREANGQDRTVSAETPQSGSGEDKEPKA
ncbi:Sec-independent protein translocase protein TatB [Desulfohalobium retbaense]|uniref:Sec-independent protein translocase protein TatA n=1 Tax=Desulfohalobium retbaense (strain ATCC 49708 / DSM 5692 / JCM 16813 / HR100) TaxID=485915 RepID=C8X1I1_DESRD|nr:Sec-independent protein translocase protein TatB [Desulfohalobium retbaense]ACV68278.1 twin-arginine translocation protein, TatB subunit [Desulfohalobium retbaense DSM 5692]